MHTKIGCRVLDRAQAYSRVPWPRPQCTVSIISCATFHTVHFSREGQGTVTPDRLNCCSIIDDVLDTVQFSPEHGFVRQLQTTNLVCALGLFRFHCDCDCATKTKKTGLSTAWIVFPLWCRYYIILPSFTYGAYCNTHHSGAPQKLIEHIMLS